MVYKINFRPIEGSDRRPLAATAATDLTTVTRREGAPPPMRVLIIEDDSSIAANLYDFLEARGHAVDAAGDGITGLHLAIAHEFDAILLDLTCPAWMGSTLCRKLREEAGKDTPVLMITARDTVDDKVRWFRARRRRLSGQTVLPAGGRGAPHFLAPAPRRQDPAQTDRGRQASLRPPHRRPSRATASR